MRGGKGREKEGKRRGKRKGKGKEKGKGKGKRRKEKGTLKIICFPIVTLACSTAL